MNDIASEISAYGEILARDAETLLADVQALLRDVGGEAGAEAGQARKELGTRLRELQARLDGLREQGKERVSEWADLTDRYAHAHPWRGMGTVAAIGAVVGALAALAVCRR